MKSRKKWMLPIITGILLLLVACQNQEEINTEYNNYEEVKTETEAEIKADSENETEAEIETESSTQQENHTMNETIFYIKAGSNTLSAVFESNSSADAFRDLLKEGDVTISMSDYGNFEKVGSLGTTLPRNDEQITTVAGDIILYQGNSITIYYDTNSWSFTRLGRIENATTKSMKEFLGDGDVEIVFSLYEN